MLKVLSAVMTEDMGITVTSKVDPVMRKNATTTEEGYQTVDITLHIGSDKSNWSFQLTIPIAEESDDEASRLAADEAAAITLPPPR